MTGKGNKTQLVPATYEVTMELARYREAYGLPPMPLPGEDRPIVPPIIDKEKALVARRAAPGAQGDLRDGGRAPARAPEWVSGMRPYRPTALTCIGSTMHGMRPRRSTTAACLKKA